MSGHNIDMNPNFIIGVVFMERFSPFLNLNRLDDV